MKYIAILLIALIALCGCTQKPEDRLACIELSTYSFTSIPSCPTVEKCFELTDSQFPIEKGQLSYSAEQHLFESKSHIARAWLFLNNAKSNLKMINWSCSSSKNLSGLAVQVNELNTNLMAFSEEVDLFSKSAASAINSELSYLKTQDINLLSSEKLYDDYIVLNQNAVDFAQKNTSSKTYASKFLSEYEKFKQVANALSLQGVLQETSLFDIISQNSGVLSKEAQKSAKETDFPVSFISPIFSGASSFFADFFALGGSVDKMQKLPSAQVFGSIEKISGLQNSAAAEFFTTFKNAALHRTELESKYLQIKSDAFSELAESSEQIEKISQKLQFLPPLEEENLSLASSLSAGEFYDFPQAILQRIESSKARITSVEQADFLGSITIGKKLFTIKEISGESQKISQDINLLENALANKQEDCSSRSYEIASKIDLEQFNSNDPQIISLREKIKVKIGSLENSSPQVCAQIVQEFALLLKYFENSSVEEPINLQIEQCINDSSQLSEFSSDQLLRLLSLKRIPRPYQNPHLVLQSCEAILEQMKNDSAQNSQVRATRDAFDRFSAKISDLKNLTFAFPSAYGQSAQQLIFSYESYALEFDTNSIALSFKKSPGLKESIEKDFQKARLLLLELLQKTIKGHMRIEKISGPEGEQDLNRVVVENIGPEIAEQFEVEVDFNSQGSVVVFSTANISHSARGKTTLLRFSKLLAGPNSIVFDSTSGNSNVEDRQQIAQKNNILSEKEELLENARSVFGIDAMPLDFYSKKIDFLASTMQLDEAKEELGVLEQEIESLARKKESEEQLRELVLLDLQKLLQAQSLQKDLEENLQLLSNNFSDLSDEELEEVYAYLPLTEQKLSELKALAQKDLEPYKAQLNLLLDSNQLFAAQKVLAEINSDSFLGQIKDAQHKASVAAQNLANASLQSYNFALAKKDASKIESGQLNEALLHSKEAHAKKSYALSLLLSTRALSLQGAASAAEGLQIPLSAYPLGALLIGVIAYFALSKKSVEKKIEKVKKAPAQE
ncbi:MAG TPA: hypothetical protein VJG83_05615 [archaeon]|nr:hypothetical protein [archaeon]